jgi:RNA polymerase sigma-70 factor (sigma-E family)
VTGWDEGLFDEFVAARMPALVRFGHALTGDLGHAEDLVQTALISAYYRWRRVPPDNPEAYVRRVMVNANISRFRRRRVVESLVDTVPEPPGPLESPEHDHVVERDEVRRLLASLSPRQRTVLALRYYADMTEAEIATTMGVREGTVKTLAARALARLRRSYEPALQRVPGLSGSPPAS